MNFLNPFTSALGAFKLLLVLACIAVGGYGTYKATSFVNNYYEYKNTAQKETAVAKEQSDEAAKKVASDKATTSADATNIATDELMSITHETEKEKVAKQVSEIRKKQPPTAVVKKPANNSSGDNGLTSPEPSTDAGDSTVKLVSAVYINTLWSDYTQANSDAPTATPAS